MNKHNRSDSEPSVMRIQSLQVPSQQRRGCQSLENTPQSPKVSFTSQYPKRKEERSINLDQYSFKMETNPTLSQLLLKLGHVIFENWQDFCGSTALQARKLSSQQSKFRSSNKNKVKNTSFPITNTPSQLNRMFGYEKVFSKLCIEQQIHLISNFICNYSCYETNGSITMRIPTHLYKYVNDDEGQMTRSHSPSSPATTSSTAANLDQIFNSNNNTTTTCSSTTTTPTRPIRGRAPLSRSINQLIAQPISVLSEMDFQYNEENDRCDSMMVLAFLLDVVLRECVQKEVTQTLIDSKSVVTILSSSEHPGDDSPCLNKQDSEEEVNHYYWREYICDVLKQTLIGGRHQRSPGEDEIDEGNDIEREMSAFSNDMTVWETLIVRIFKSFLDFDLEDRLSNVETTKEQSKRLKKHFKTSVKNVDEVLQHDMCRLAFVCQSNATLFQSNFRPTAEKYIDSLRQEGKMMNLSLEMSGELPFITVCYWHTLMCRGGVHAYLSSLERVKAFHRVVEKAIFPIKHIAKNPTEPSQVSRFCKKFFGLFQ